MSNKGKRDEPPLRRMNDGNEDSLDISNVFRIRSSQRLPLGSLLLKHFGPTPIPGCGLVHAHNVINDARNFCHRSDGEYRYLRGMGFRRGGGNIYRSK